MSDSLHLEEDDSGLFAGVIIDARAQEQKQRLELAQKVSSWLDEAEQDESLKDMAKQVRSGLNNQSIFWQIKDILPGTPLPIEVKGGKWKVTSMMDKTDSFIGKAVVINITPEFTPEILSPIDTKNILEEVVKAEQLANQSFLFVRITQNMFDVYEFVDGAIERFPPNILQE
jgi:hypothetical protein